MNATIAKIDQPETNLEVFFTEWGIELNLTNILEEEFAAGVPSDINYCV